MLQGDYGKQAWFVLLCEYDRRVELQSLQPDGGFSDVDRDDEQEEPWIILTDLPPEDAGPSWYALHFWIKLGFKAVKSLGWKWDKTRRTDPARISRHWLVLSVATLLALAYGTRVEDAHDRRIAPGNLRTPPKTPDPRRRDPWGRPVRTVSVIRHGIDWLRWLLLRGRLWSRVWLLPEPWPKPKPNLEIIRHAPA